MKTRTSLLVVLWVGLTAGALPAWSAEAGRQPSPAPAKSPKQAAAPAKTEKKAAPAAAAEEAEGNIAGITIPRASGGFLGLEIVGGNFKLSFYDVKKKPVPVDVARATARWDNKQKLGSDFTVLNPASDNQSLVGAKFVRPPYTFIVFLNLLNAAGEAVESYPVNMMQ